MAKVQEDADQWVQEVGPLKVHGYQATVSAFDPGALAAGGHRGPEAGSVRSVGSSGCVLTAGDWNEYLAWATKDAKGQRQLFKI